MEQTNANTPPPSNILTTIRAAIRGGMIDGRQAQQMRKEFGIAQSTFTKKLFNRVTARAAGKRAKIARKNTRGRIKGQKCNKGLR